MYSPSSGSFKNSSAMHPYNTSPNMYSPRNNASSGMYLPRNNSPQDFSSQRTNSPYGIYSPNNTLQGRYSPQSSPRGMYSPRNTSQNVYSPGNTSQNMYSPRNTSQPMYPHRSSLPMRQQLYRKSFNNRSRNSSDFNSSNQSFGSNESFSPRGKPYNKWNKKGGHSERPYNIQDYINPSMLEDPWAGLPSVKNAKKYAGSQS